MGLIWGSLAPSPRPRLLGFTKTPVCTRNRKSISTTRIWNHNDGTADCSNMNLPLHCLLFCFRFCCISQFYVVAVDRCRKDFAFAFSFSKLPCHLQRLSAHHFTILSMMMLKSLSPGHLLSFCRTIARLLLARPPSHTVILEYFNIKV